MRILGMVVFCAALDMSQVRLTNMHTKLNLRRFDREACPMSM
jgi:hypothetical protein